MAKVSKPYTLNQQVIIRLPTDLAKKVVSIPEIEPFELISEGNRFRIFRIKILGEIYPAVLLDLPCHIESQKTFGNSIFYKCGDVSQMLKVYPKNWQGKDFSITDQTVKNNSDLNSSQDGLSPPTKGIRKLYTESKVCNCDLPLNNTLETAPAVCKKCNCFYKKKVEWATSELLRAKKGDCNEFYCLDEQLYETDETASSDEAM